MTKKIASFESLEYLFSKDKCKYHCVTFPQSACSGLVKANYAKSKVISVDISQKLWSDEKKVITSTNLTDLFHKKAISGLVLDTHSSNFIENWAKKENIRLIVTPWKLQKKLENKIFFERLLKKHDLPSPKSWILKSKKDIESVDDIPVVVQSPDSNGSKGTFFVKKKSEISRLITSRKLKFPLLCREFIDNGLPLGVSVLVSPNKMIFSALRAQAYFPKSDGKSIYYGIQWVKTSHIQKNVIEKLNSILEKTGKMLQEFGFYGIANFDLIIRDDEILFIECNPRLGGSTPQISLRPELLHGLHFTNEFTRACCGQELTSNKPYIPNSKYEGFNLDMDALTEPHHGTQINTLKVGFYKPSKDSFIYSSSVKSEFEKDSTIFIYHALPKNIRISDNIFTGFLMRHRPLLKLTKNSYNFSEAGNKFLKIIENLIIKNGTDS
ncbi:MAG: ATP-grasp domain-containing protein [Nitrospirota bacterium]